MHNSPWNKFGLNGLLVKRLIEIGFEAPTDIQSHTLPYTKSRTDLIISSKTGSGKTLCFALPIMNDLYNEMGLDVDYKEGDQVKSSKRSHVRALILTPTRELALQIKDHFGMLNEYTKKLVRIGVIVGGLAKEKQERILGQNPQIVVATPGRLWDLMDQDYNPFLQTVNKINFLVLDEADKMIELGHFKELDKILGFVYRRESKIKDNLGFMEDEQEEDFLGDFYIKGGKNKIIPLTDKKIGLVDTMKQRFKNAIKNAEEGSEDEENKEIEQGDQNDQEEEENFEEDNEEEMEDFDEEDGNDNFVEENEEEFDENDMENEENEDEQFEEEFENGEYEDEQAFEQEEEEEKEDDEEQIEEEEEEDPKSKRRRQKKKKQDDDEPKFVPNPNRRTILLSATLANAYDPRTRKPKKKKGKKQNEKDQVQIKGADEKTFKLDLLVKRVQFNGTPKLIDLTKKDKMPEKLTEYKSLCTEDEKVLYLYHILERFPAESIIVFVNTITHARRVYSVLNRLNFKVVCLHSEMQQRQRLKKLEQFTKKVFNILVCTDVAARGLDIPSVNYVVHFQVPKDPDTYVHRSGRTARIGREGTTYTLIGPGDKSNYLKICKVLNRDKGIENLDLSQVELEKIKKFVNAAVNLERNEFLLHRKERHRQWFLKNAERADIELDDMIKNELEQVEDEITKKRKIVGQNKVNYKKVRQEAERNKINPRKGKAVFLDPSKIAEIAKKLSGEGPKEVTKPQWNERKKSPKKFKKRMI